MPHWQAVSYSKNERRGLGCGSTFSICQDVLKSVILQHKLGFFDSQMVGTVEVELMRN